MKSILMSIQPYWGFLIIAKERGWDLEKYGLHVKAVEVRKRVPTSPDWDKKVAMYFSKDKKSLARIPEEYRGEIAKLCGTVVCEFVCDEIYDLFPFGMGTAVSYNGKFVEPELFRLCTCLTHKEIEDYLGNKDGYGLHISDLKIYDKPRELSKFHYPCTYPNNTCYECAIERLKPHCHYAGVLERPPQSWCYVEEQ